MSVGIAVVLTGLSLLCASISGMMLSLYENDHNKSEETKKDSKYSIIFFAFLSAFLGLVSLWVIS
jgi:hypothetical protein